MNLRPTASATISATNKLTGGDRDRAALLLAQALGDTTVTPYNLFRGGRDVAFMRAHYPTVPYEPREGASSAVSTYAPLAVAAANAVFDVIEGLLWKRTFPIKRFHHKFY